jgi:hypothetical protein
MYADFFMSMKYHANHIGIQMLPGCKIYEVQTFSL